jgi:hypothetical protein
MVMSKGGDEKGDDGEVLRIPLHCYLSELTLKGLQSSLPFHLQQSPYFHSFITPFITPHHPIILITFNNITNNI